MNNKECKNCKVGYYSYVFGSEFCSIPCRKEFNLLEKCKLQGLSTVKCEICGKQTRSVISHLKNHKDWKGREEYKAKFPGAQIEPDDVIERKRIGSANAGARMREPEHRKRLSEIASGEKNPMHSSRVSKEFRKTISPFSPEFYKSRGHSEEDSIRLAKEKGAIAIRTMTENDGFWNKKEYWLKRGFSEEEAKKIVSEKQVTFSKEKCIERYGEEEGLKIWSARQEKWMATMDSKSEEEKLEILKKKIFHNKVYSENSQELFKKINEALGEGDFFFATSIHGEGNIETVNKQLFKPDFCWKNKIIEFFGTYWHCDPSHPKYGVPGFYIRRGSKKYTAASVWKIDKWRIEELQKSGYEVLVIWESEWNKSPEETIQKCLDFLNN